MIAMNCNKDKISKDVVKSLKQNFENNGKVEQRS